MVLRKTALTMSAPPAADLHARDALVPAPDDLAGSEPEAKRVAAVARAVELAPVGQPARVVDGHLLSGRGFGALARLQLGVLEARGGGLELAPGLAEIVAHGSTLD